MKKNSGEIVIICALVGLVVGGAMLYIESGREAQARANARGYPVHQSEVIADAPGKSALTLFGPAVAGAGVGWALQELSGGGSEASRDNSVRINDNDGTVNVNIRGDGGDSSSTRTDTTTRTDTRTNQ